MAKYTFVVDGADFTDLFHKYGYEVYYEFREGENGGLMCSGDELRDLLAVKPTVYGTTNDAPTERVTALLTACLKNEVLLRYFDPWTGAEKTITAHPEVETVSVLLDNAGAHWWKGFRVTMRAK